MELWMKTARPESIKIQVDFNENYRRLVNAVQFPYTDGMAIWKWKVGSEMLFDRLFIEIIYPVQLEVISVCKFGTVYQCRSRIYQKHKFQNILSYNDLINEVQDVLRQYSLVYARNMSAVDLEFLKELNFPCVQGPFKITWSINVGVPMKITVGGITETTASFCITRYRLEKQHDAIRGEVCQETNQVTLRFRSDTKDTFDSIQFDFGEKINMLNFIQAIVESYGMLEYITKEHEIKQRNILTYDTSDQGQQFKIWNEVELSTITFPQTDGSHVYEWLVSDRDFDEIYRFPGELHPRGYLSVTLKYPYFKNVILVILTENNVFKIAYKELEDINFTRTDRETPVQVRACIRTTLQTYEKHITTKDTTVVGSSASAWDCLSRIADVVAALSRP